MVSRAQSARPRAGSPARAACAPLAGLIVVMAVFGVTWALLVPPWQSPDEIWHFAYAQSLAERLALPGDESRLPISSAQTLAAAADNSIAMPSNTDQVRPDWSSAAYRQYLAQAAAHPSNSDGGGPNPETANPPLLYFYDDLAYWASGSSNPVDLLYAMRVWNVTLLLATVAGAWLLAGEVFGRRRLAQLVCASVVGLIPQQTFISTSVNPDALLVALWTLALWVGVRVITRRAQTRDVVALFALTAAAILTKATGYALVPPTLLAVGIGWRRRPAAERRSTGRHVLLASPVLLVPVLGWVGLSESLGRTVVNAIRAPVGVRPKPFRIPQFFSYIWEFYLPRLPFMSRIIPGSGLPAFDVWIKQGWGIFGYADVMMPAWIYKLLGVVTAAVAVASVGLLARTRNRVALLPCAFLAAAGFSLLLLLHVSDYRSILASGDPLVQGRYLLPISSLFGLAVAWVTIRLPPRWRAGAAGALIAALLVLQVLALATVAKTYYT